jgi:hypothetical protein
LSSIGQKHWEASKRGLVCILCISNFALNCDIRGEKVALLALLACAGSRSAKKAMASHIVLVPLKRRQLYVALFHCEAATRGA